MILSATLDAKNLETVTQTIMEELARLAEKPPSGEELQEAKTHIESDHVYARETVQGVARSMGAFKNQLDDAEYAEKYLTLNAAVRPEQISAAVHTYLMPPNVTVSVLLPEGEAKDFRIENLEKIVSRFQPGVKTVSPPRSMPADSALFKKLSNGVKVVLVPDNSNPVISFRIACLGGKRFETEDTQGIMNFMARMLKKGAAGMTEEEIARKVNEMGGSVDGFSGYDSFGLYASFFSRYWNQGLELLSQMYADPTFSQDKLERERDLIINNIKTEQESPTEYLLKVLNKTVFPTAPYGFDQLGTVHTVSAFTGDDLKQAYHRFAVPSNTVIAVVGKMDTIKVMDALEQLFGKTTAKTFGNARGPRCGTSRKGPRDRDACAARPSLSFHRFPISHLE